MESDAVGGMKMTAIDFSKDFNTTGVPFAVEIVKVIGSRGILNRYRIRNRNSSPHCAALRFAALRDLLKKNIIFSH